MVQFKYFLDHCCIQKRSSVNMQHQYRRILRSANTYLETVGLGFVRIVLAKSRGC